ncbi:MAG: energy transducer TonB, partial [Pseudomonadota bacterium]
MAETSLVETGTFRREDSAGLVVAIALHAGVVALLLLQPVRQEVFDVPQRMTVSLASEVGLEATAPEPVPESRAAIAPTLSELPAPDSEAPQTDAGAQTAPPPPPPAATSQPRRTAPAPTRDRQRPDRQEREQPAAQEGGGSRIGNDFLQGGGSSTRTDETRLPASQIGASAKASIIQAIAREIKPHWNAPEGADAELLVSILAFDLNEDGSLKGRPRVIRQSGVNASNRPQA